MNGSVAGEAGGALAGVRRCLYAALVAAVAALLPAPAAHANLAANIAAASKAVDDANREARDNIPGNHRIKDAEDRLDRAAQANDDTPANANQRTKDANQAAEDSARAAADALREDMDGRTSDEQKERHRNYRKALEDRREARRRLKELEKRAARHLGAVRRGPFDQAQVRAAEQVLQRVRRKLAESEAVPESRAITQLVPEPQARTQTGRMPTAAPSSTMLKSTPFQPVKAKLVTDSQQYCTFGKAAPTTVSFAPTDSPAAPKPPEQPTPGDTPSAGGGTPPTKPTPTAGNPPGGGASPTTPGGSTPPPPEKPNAGGGPTQVADGPPAGQPHGKKRRRPYGPPKIGWHGGSMTSIDPPVEKPSPEDILDDLGDDGSYRAMMSTIDPNGFPVESDGSPASTPPTKPGAPQQAAPVEDILDEIGQGGSTPSKAETTKAPPQSTSAPPPETPAGKTDKPTTITGLPGAPQTATPVAIYFKARESVLEGTPDLSQQLKTQVVKLVPAQEPALPMTTGSNGVPSDAVKTAIAKKALDTGFDRSPVQCTTGANGECQAEIPADERELYGFPQTGAGSYRAELNTLQNSGGVVENLGNTPKSNLFGTPPKGLNVVKSTFKIGDRTYARLTYAGTSDRIGALTSDYAKRFGKNYQTDFCEEKKPGPPVGTDLSSFRALARELPQATVKLEDGAGAR